MSTDTWDSQLQFANTCHGTSKSGSVAPKSRINLQRWLGVLSLNLNIVSHKFAFCFPQDYAAKNEREISRLTKKVKSEHDARVSAEGKLEESEQTMTNLTQENANLQSKITEMDKIWNANLEEACNKLQTAETELSDLKKMITQMLTALIGKSSTCYLWLTQPFCFLYLLPY